MPQPGLLLGGPERAGFKPIWRLLFSLGCPEGNRAETCSAQAHELSLRMEARGPREADWVEPPGGGGLSRPLPGGSWRLHRELVQDS